MTKMTVTCTGFRPMQRNTLQGFATLRIPDICLTIHDVAVHQKNASRWVQLPSKPQVDKNGNLIKDSSGKTRYSVLFEFDNDAVRKAFSARACAAIAEAEPDAFREVETTEGW